MTISNIEKTIKFTVDLLHDKEIEFKKDHPWRGHGLHALQHGLRVASIVLEIIERGKLIFSPEIIEDLQIAAILHDVGYVVTRENHALKSAEMVDEFLNTLINKERQERILTIIREHSDKSSHDKHLYKSVFKDADIIDEYGVQSLLMCANWVDRGTPFFFKALEERVGNKELSFADQLLSTAYTNGAKEIIQEKKMFMNELHQQLKYENNGSLSYETYLTYRD